MSFHLFNLKYLSLFSPESLLVLASLVLDLIEVTVENSGDVNSVEGDLGGGGNHVGLIHSLKGDSVDLVRSCHQQ